MIRTRALAMLPVTGLLALGAPACGLETGPSADHCAALANRPVLFVHGSGLDSTSWSALRDYLARSGHRADWLAAVDLQPSDGANERAAREFIAPAAEQLLARTHRAAQERGCPPPTRIDLVAHSMGSMSARWYAAFIAPERVHTLIGIAPANHGTDALCGHAGDGNREMCPAFARDAGDGAFQFALNGSAARPRDETPYGVAGDERRAVSIPPDAARAIRYFTIRIDPDEWIVPARSAVLDGAGPAGALGSNPPAHESSPGNFLVKEPVAHDSLPAHGPVMRMVRDLLSDRAIE